MGPHYQMPLVLLPAAGFGRRAGSPESKEMLPDETGRPLIDWAIDQAFARGWPVHVILRPQKVSLIRHLKKRQEEGALSLQEIRGSLECSHSLLLSRHHWRENNIVILPDTRWQPTNALDSLAAKLQEFAAAYGTFPITAPEEWGTVSLGNQAVRIAEKCGGPGSLTAWGLLGFRRAAGVPLLAAHLESHLRRSVQEAAIACTQVPLQSFVDLTRPDGPLGERSQPRALMAELR